MEGAITLRHGATLRGSELCRAHRIAIAGGNKLHQSVFPAGIQHRPAQSELTSLAYSIIRLLPPASIRHRSINSASPACRSDSCPSAAIRLGPKEIRDLAYFTVRQQIATIPGISFGPPLGGKVRQITVFLDQSRMLARASRHRRSSRPSIPRAPSSRPATSRSAIWTTTSTRIASSTSLTRSTTFRSRS